MSGTKVCLYVVLGVLAGLTWPVLPIQSQEQRYDGRTFAEWQGALKDLSPNVREKAVKALGHFGPRAVPLLIPALKDVSPDVRVQAAYALGQLGPAAKAAIPALIEAMVQSEDWQWSLFARYLKAIGPPTKDEVRSLVQLLKDANSDVRKIAAIVLGNAGPVAKDATPQLQRLAASDPDQEVRTAASRALGQIQLSPHRELPAPPGVNCPPGTYWMGVGCTSRPSSTTAPDALVAALEAYERAVKDKLNSDLV